MSGACCSWSVVCVNALIELMTTGLVLLDAGSMDCGLHNIIFYIEVWVRKEREALLVAAANSRSEPVFPVGNSPAGTANYLVQNGSWALGAPSSELAARRCALHSTAPL
jgi:hypothetical protein